MRLNEFKSDGSRGFGCRHNTSVVLVLALALLIGWAETARGEVDFAREVLPILSDKCFVCHGPDTQKKDFLRLDSFEGATEDRGGYQAINPTAPEESELIARIQDEDDPMPPSDAEKQLTQKEREILIQWTRQGGDYAKHWAFELPGKVAPPEPVESIRNEIDAFIGAGLSAAEAQFAPEADQATLARRAALVLTGLPPEPEQLAAFMGDPSPDAYDRLVDELLSSPRFGEHQARYWLDAVRYGDTHGLHLDNRRGIYPYRDWVVKAFNDNLPFDDFITWQVAGDLLPNPTFEQTLATGFVRMNPTTSEGGAIPAEFQAKNNFDRTETLGTVFLGMTLTCARCHTHKYDPITQEEYYRLFAFFNSTSESSMDGNAYEYGPTLRLPKDPSAWPAWKDYLKERDRLLKRGGFDRNDTSDFVSYASARTGWKTAEWTRTKALASGSEIPEEDQFSTIRGLPGTARRQSLPQKGEVIYVDFDLEVPAEQTLWLSFLGGAGSEVHLDGQEVDWEAEVLVGFEQQEALVPLRLKEGSHQMRLKIAGSTRQGDIEVRLRNPWDAVAKREGFSGVSVADRLLLLADSQGPLAGKELSDKALRLARRQAAESSNLTTTLVARDLATPRETKILRRGEYNLPTGDPLEPDVLRVMGSLPTGAPKNRLGLAEWLVSRENPVVARVLINRIWQRVYGYGLVRSPEDFGLQGQYPTHPELLDWLALEWQDRGWDLKEMIRLMVTSRTFRQSSRFREDVADPENRLFSRGPAHRLDAEVLRDMGLWASGILDPHMGGEGVKPYQPSGMWLALAHPASNTKLYVQDKGRRLYRRSLYVYWKRTSPHPMMTLFDAPSRESSCVRRSRTNTPLQSLGLLNETQRIEMARMFAERLLKERTDDASRLELMFELLASRAPLASERLACDSLLERMKERYTGAEDDAVALLSIGELERDAGLLSVEHAAWTQVASAVMASDAAILLY